MIPAITASSAKACVLLLCLFDTAFPVGGWQGKWLELDRVLENVHKGKGYTQFTADKTLSKKFVITYVPDASEVREEEYYSSDMLMMGGKGGTMNMTLGTNCPNRIRKARPISTNNKTYKKIARDFLKSRGYSDNTPMFIKQIVKIDLENDGTDEVFITVQSSENYETQWIDTEAQGPFYCYTFMRKIGKNGQVKTTVLAEDHHTSQEMEEGSAITYESRVIGFVDLNNDGISEMIMIEEYYEGWEVGLWQLKKNGEFEVISGVGAGV